jgi:hypothetical protein
MIRVLPVFVERRASAPSDRRTQSRNGRRQSDPQPEWRWRRAAWLFAASAAVVSIRSLPSNLRRLFGRRTA